MVSLTMKQRREILKALESVADSDGIADIRKAAGATGHNYTEINDVVKRVGFRRVDAWRINVKIVDV